MDYTKDKELIQRLVNESPSITSAAKKYAAAKGRKYTDSIRRIVSQTLKRNGGSNSQPKKNQKWEEDAQKGTACYEAIVAKKITTLEQALEVSNVDEDIWEVEKWVCNSWGVTSFHNGKSKYKTNFQVKVWLRRRQVTLEEAIDEVLPFIEDYTPKKIKKGKGTGTGVVALTDFHLGADIKDLVRGPDFNIDILLDYIAKTVEIINSKKYKKVHVILLGDFFESLTGMNHENTFKGLGRDMWGANPIIMANEVIGDQLLSKIKNLTSVYMVSGNHDRMAASRKAETTGEGGKLLWYLLQKSFPGIPIEYHNSVISAEIDGINYLMTHGDKGFSKKDFGKFVSDYGKSGIYNLILEGHLHSRIVKKAHSAVRKVYEDLEVVSFDELNYRKVVVASLFTGNLFSESLGFGTNAGMTICENNGSGKPNVFDYCL